MNIPIFFTSLFLIASQYICGQNLIGYSKEKVRGIMKNEMKGFAVDNSAVNPVYNYLKFINSAGTKTLIVFFDEKNISKNVRLVSDYSELNFLIKDYDALYKKTGEKCWEYNINNETYTITLEEKEWYFLVYIEKKTGETEIKCNQEKTKRQKKRWLWKLLN